jgi:hypothetical protein
MIGLGSSKIEPVSARFAAQMQEMLQANALKRMAAERASEGTPFREGRAASADPAANAEAVPQSAPTGPTMRNDGAATRPAQMVDILA